MLQRSSNWRTRGHLEARNLKRCHRYLHFINDLCGHEGVIITRKLRPAKTESPAIASGAFIAY